MKLSIGAQGRCSDRWAWSLCALLVAACHDDATPGDGGHDGTAGSTGTGETSDASGGASNTHGTADGTDGGSDGSSSSGGHDSGGHDGGGAGDELPYDPDQLGVVCARGNADPIAIRLCADPSPQLGSLADLYDALDMVIEPASFALLANSTSLSARSVSVINPRVFLRVQPGQGTGVDLGATAFSRGEQVVELFGYDAAADQLNFYLLTFFQDCNDDADGCSLADRFTPAVEQGWTKWSLYQDLDLVNRPLDCLTCHQPDGPDSPKLLLMQQAVDPWLHWFPGVSIGTGGETSSATLLTPQFLAMHGDEAAYGGIPIAMIAPPAPTASGIVMNQMIEIYWSIQGGVPSSLTPLGQPQPFDSGAVEADIAAGYSDTWDGYFAQVLGGERLPVPWHHHDITDATLRDAAVASYLDVAGGADPASMLDPRAVLSAQTEVELGFRPRAQASAEEMLRSLCQRCHNPRLDQTLSRARFDASDPGALTAEQKAAAIDRLGRQPHEPGAMPPPRFASLAEDQRLLLVEFLSH